MRSAIRKAVRLIAVGAAGIVGLSRLGFEEERRPSRTATTRRGAPPVLERPTLGPPSPERPGAGVPPDAEPLRIPRGAMTLRIAHPFSRDEAHARIDKLLREWSRRFGVRSSWRGDLADVSANVFGMSLQGQVRVGDATVDAWGTDPGMLLRDRAAGYLRWKIARYLDPRRSLEEVNGT